MPWYAEWDCSSISLYFAGFKTVDQKTAWLLQNAYTFHPSDQNIPLQSIMFCLSIPTYRSPNTFFFFVSYICFLWHYLCSQMISATRTVIKLVCFSLQAALSKYEKRVIWISENECCFFHLVLYITWGLETGKINVDLLLSVPCDTVNLDTINLNYSTFYLRFWLDGTHMICDVLYGIGRCSFGKWGQTANTPLPSCASLCSPPVSFCSFLLQSPLLKVTVLKYMLVEI